jgi:hypothetical protein
MKSQKFDLEGNRLEIGPNSGDFATQASKQRGEDAHIFAPMGFLDETWFHRSYWVLGQSFAGGHGGYFQAGRFAPSGRLLVQGDGYAFGYGRKPEYLRWTTTLEHQLFAAEQNPPEIPETFTQKGKGKGKATVVTAGTYADFGKPKGLDPTGKPLTVEAWVTATKPQGVIIARGGPSNGFALIMQGGKPAFLVRSKNELTTITGKKRIVGGWHHVAGVLGEDKSMKLFVDGELAGQATANGLITADPAQGLEVGLDAGSSVGEYQAPFAFSGVIDEIRLYFSAADDAQIAKRFEDGSEISSDAVLAVSFDDGTARDHSTSRHDGTLQGGTVVDGKFGKAIQFSARSGKAANNNQTKPGNSLVSPKWTQDVPIYVRGMVLAGPNLFLVGPPDIIDEEKTFQQLTEKDPRVQELLDKQNLALEGSDGAWLLAVNKDTGEIRNGLHLDSLPAWDGLAGANGRLFLSTLDGEVVCFGK